MTMKWELTEIEKLKSISFDEMLELKNELMARDSNVLNLSVVEVNGTVSYEDGFYDLFFVADYQITVPSTRSLEPVSLNESTTVHEVYVRADSHQDFSEDDFIMVLEDDELSLDEAVADNILLEIPSRVLTDEEKSAEELPAGENWQVLSEEGYEAAREKEKEENSPFKDLDKLF